MTHVQSRDRLFIRLSSFKSITGVVCNEKPGCLFFVVSHFVSLLQLVTATTAVVQPHWWSCWRRRRNLSRGSARNAASQLTGQTLSIACITQDIQAMIQARKKSFHRELVLFRLWFSRVRHTWEALEDEPAGGVGAQCEPQWGVKSIPLDSRSRPLAHLQCSKSTFAHVRSITLSVIWRDGQLLNFPLCKLKTSCIHYFKGYYL